MTAPGEEAALKVERKFTAGFIGSAFAVALLLCVAALPAAAGSFDGCLASVTEKDAAAIADTSGRILHAVNEKKPHIPASTLKILTALTALRSFGPSYRFETHLFLGPDATLYVKGFGDPLLTSEVLNAMAAAVSGRVRRIERIVVDHSYFSPVVVPGTGRSANPYDAPVGALSVNFNTVSIAIRPDGKPVSAEPQTPLLGYALTRLDRIGVKRAGRYTFVHTAEEAAVYTGELLAHFLAENGIPAVGSVESGTVPADSTPLVAWQSPYTLEEVVERMMEFSNNFVANQLFIATGARELGAPGNLQKALEVTRDLAERQLGMSSVRIAEGSGISRSNRISASDMLVLLGHFAPYRHLLKEQFGAVYKTGTLSGIRTRAGYLEPVPEKPCPFVLFINEDIEKTDNMVQCLARSAGAQREKTP